MYSMADVELLENAKVVPIANMGHLIRDENVINETEFVRRIETANLEQLHGLGHVVNFHGNILDIAREAEMLAHSPVNNERGCY